MPALCVIILTASYYGFGNTEEMNTTVTRPWRIKINFNNSYTNSFTLNTFLTTLFQITEKQMENTQHNILKNYNLKSPEVDLLIDEFRHSSIKHKYTVVYNLKDKTNTTHYEESEEFMLGMMEYSNTVLYHMIAYHLDKVGGKLLELTDWEQQSLKDKILRQQSKIAINAVERNICETLSLCYDKIYYSEYLADWLAVLMNSSPHTLKMFFGVVSQFLDGNVHKVKTSNKFRQIAREFVKANTETQRDIVDFFHEIITNHNKTFDKVPLTLNQYAILSTDLFIFVDDNYDINVENVKILKRIDKDFLQWTKSGNSNLKNLFNVATDNMLLNIRIWPLQVQSKIDYIWLKIIS